MSAPQIIRTPGGEELVVLPRAEYEALLERADHEAEDADDVAIYDARKAELAAGGVVLPPEVSAAILRGGESVEGHSQLARRDTTAVEFQNRYRSGLSVRSRKWTPYGNPRDHREARAGFECTGGVAFVDYFAGLSGAHDSLVVQALEAHIGLRRVTVTRNYCTPRTSCRSTRNRIASMKLSPAAFRAIDSAPRLGSFTASGAMNQGGAAHGAARSNRAVAGDLSAIEHAS